MKRKPRDASIAGSFKDFLCKGNLIGLLELGKKVPLRLGKPMQKGSVCQQQFKDLSLQVLEDRMKDLGLKVTQPRRKLLGLLMQGRGPLAAEEIQAALKDSDLVTIYRSLNTFVDLGLVQKLEFGDGIARFELMSHNHHHHHVICKKCQKVDVLHICNVEPHLEAVKKLGYTQVTHRLEFFGLCSKCQSST